MSADDDDEFRDYVAAQRPALLRLAYLLTGEAHEAEDLTQTALARTYVAWNLRAYDRDGTLLATYKTF